MGIKRSESAAGERVLVGHRVDRADKRRETRRRLERSVAVCRRQVEQLAAERAVHTSAIWSVENQLSRIDAYVRQAKALDAHP